VIRHGAQGAPIEMYENGADLTGLASWK